MHQIEFKLESFNEDEHHKVRNFVEALWRQLELAGWVERENFDQRINPGATFRFTFPARQSHKALMLVDRTIKQHMMGLFVTFTRMKKAKLG